MNNVWILVCNSARARFFEKRKGERSWYLLNEVTHDESRARASELASDQSGNRSSEGASVHHNALAPASSPKEVEKSHFARELAGILDQAQRSARFRRWVLASSPHFAGLVRSELTRELEKGLLATVDKDLCYLGAEELAARLEDVARIPVNEEDPIREPHRHPH
jgi:protein required for attachment to host cells